MAIASQERAQTLQPVPNLGKRNNAFAGQPEIISGPPAGLPALLAMAVLPVATEAVSEDAFGFGHVLSLQSVVVKTKGPGCGPFGQLARAGAEEER